jgi:uncharacterized protein
MPGAAKPPVLFLDANVFVSAAWKAGSEVARLWQIAGIRLVTSNYVMGEVQRNLHHAEQIERLRILMRSVQILSFDADLETSELASLPEKDRPILAGAIESQADFLVSGDKTHFGHLYGKTINGVRITSPPEILKLLEIRRP